MDRQERNELHNLAKERLAANTVSPRKLVAVHTGAILMISLASAAVQYLLQQQIGNTGGIGGMGTRAILSTAQYVLQIAQMLLIPIWEIGILYTALRIARNEQAAYSDLAEGFRRFFPVLRLHVFRSAIFAGIGFISVYAGTMIFFATPFARPIMEQMAALMTDVTLLSDPDALQQQLLPILEANIMPLLIFTGIVFVGLSLPVLYRYRMASFYLLDETEKGALNALRSSRKLMRFLCIDFFKLDLKFWLYYVLDLLVTAVCYGDTLLELLGIQLPFKATTAYFVFLIAYAVCQLALYWWKRSEVETTYACAYCSLRERFSPLSENNNTP